MTEQGENILPNGWPATTLMVPAAQQRRYAHLFYPDILSVNFINNSNR